MKLIIAGTRSFDDYELLKKIVLYRYGIAMAADNLEIVSGTAKGADQLGEIFANANSLKLTRFPADWNKYGKAAGPIRNRRMAQYADAAIVFWDAYSKGSLNMIQTMRDLGKPVYVVIYPKESKDEEAKKN